ncbi:MAG TPA: AmmeMemoRadiSam system radical SAM enzyme [Candidatus Polarisedimenticolia bacterium]|jgi:pyruvate formate lyase activating enzyme|nr:AmmeMemoRadiSam system radical SAM enzyme [Candidatus Polarisedimenticolia bacterium]
MAQAVALAEVLHRLTREGELYEKHPDGSLTCFACGHRCLIRPGREGICKVRFNRAGILRVPHGYVGALNVDPIEKKPFFHVLPGSPALSFGMLGCDYHCGYCQNWFTSQAIRDPKATARPEAVTAADLVALALRASAPVLASTYNEPLITSEWAVEVFREGRTRGLLGAFISNGNGTEEALGYLRPWLDLYKVDLKSMRESNYRALGGQLRIVLDTIRRLKAMDFWLEVVTLVIPGFNDSDEELRDAAAFLVSVSPEIPWHVTAFHKDYRMTDPADTPPQALLRAARIGKEAGLQFVYAGNLPGHVGEFENTCCPSCGACLVRRRGYRILENRLRSGSCPDCGGPVPGRWTLPAAAGAPEQRSAG